MEVIDLDLQDHLTIIQLKKPYLILLLYTDLGRPRGITHPKHALVIVIIVWNEI